MAFLDSTQGQSSQQQSQTPNVDKLPEAVKAQAVDAARPAAQLMEKATAHQTQAPGDHAAPSDGKEALIRNQGGQGKEQPAMSPTDHSKSHTPSQQRTMERGRGMER
jgi:hypothetical protein